MLAVGDSTELEIIFSTKKYKREVKKQPRIQTNEGPPDKSVKIISTIITRPDSTFPIRFSPYKLDLSQFGEKVRDEIEFEITNASEEPLDLTLIDMPIGMFEVELPESLKAGQTKKGVLKLDKSVMETSFQKSMTIEVNDTGKSRFTIPVKRTLRNPATATNKISKGKSPASTSQNKGTQKPNTVSSSKGGGK